MPSWKNESAWFWLAGLLSVPNSFIVSLPFTLQYGWVLDNVWRVWAPLCVFGLTIYWLQPLMLWVEETQNFSKRVMAALSCFAVLAWHTLLFWGTFYFLLMEYVKYFNPQLTILK